MRPANLVPACALAVALVSPALAGEATRPPEPLTLEACLDLAATSNPSVVSAWHAWLAASGAAVGAGSLPDPVVSYAYSVTPVETRVGPQEARFGIRQTLPWFGKLRLKSEAARAGADAAYQRYRRAAADAAYEATAAYAEYASLGITIDILERREALLADLESAVRARYAAGDAPYSDLVRAGIERARMSDRLLSAQARRGPASARLSVAIGLAPSGQLPWPGEIPSLDTAVARDAASGLESRSPELLMLDSEIERGERTRSLAGRAYLPDLSVGVDYIVTGEASMPVEDSGKDPLSVSASIGVPLWFGKYTAGVREETERLTATRQARRQKLNELEARLSMALFSVDDSDRRVTLYSEQIVPDAERSLESARAAYGSGAIGFESVVAAEQTALEMELALEAARVEAVEAAAGLARLLALGTAAEPPRDMGDVPPGQEPLETLQESEAAPKE